MEKADQITQEDLQKNAPDTATYVGALLVLVPVVPIVAAIVSIVIFAGPDSQTSVRVTSHSWLDSITPLLIGTLSALVLWFLFALFFRRFTAVHRANEKSYYALLNHLSALDYYLGILPKGANQSDGSAPPGSAPGQSGTPAPSGSVSSQPPNKSIDASDPREEVQHYRDAIYLGLMQKSTSWILADGYIKLWDLMDSAEEALITFAPLEEVVSWAIRDEMRLNDSKIANSEEWANKLRLAVKALDPSAVNYLKPAPGIQPPAAGTQQAPQGTGIQPSAINQGKIAQTQQEAEARAVLRRVRETINDFNIKSWGR